jgi:cobalt-zinc-cadmium efflux system outer membrane protein
MRKYISIIIILLLNSSILSAQDILSEYLETAAANNPGLKAKFSEYMAALEVVPQVGTLPDPQLAFGYFIQPIETRNGPQRMVLSLNQMFPWFGSLGAKRDAAASQAKVKYESFEAYKSKLFFEVQATYYELYFIGKGIDISLENIRILESFRNLALVKIEAGKASGVDEIRIEMELADLENKLAYLKDRLNYHSLKFNKLINVENDRPIIIPDSLRNIDLAFHRQAVLDSLRLRNPEVQKLDLMMDVYKDKEQIARKSGAPSFSIGIDYFVIEKGENPMADVDNGKNALLFPKVGITIPLYRKKYTSMVNEAVYMQQAMEGAKEEKVNALEVLFEQSYNEYQDAVRRIRLYSSQSILAEKGIRILEAEYSTNGKNFEEILRMERRLLGYSLELQKAYADKQVSIAFINYLMGI